GALHIHASLDPGFLSLVIREIGALAALVLAIDAARLDHLLIVILRLFALCRAGGCLVLIDRALRGLTAQILVDTPVGGIELRLIVGRRGGGVLVRAVAFDELGTRRPVIAVLDVPLRVHPLPDVLRVRAARRKSAREEAGCEEPQLKCYVSAHGGRPQVRQRPSQGQLRLWGPGMAVPLTCVTVAGRLPRPGPRLAHRNEIRRANREVCPARPGPAGGGIPRVEALAAPRSCRRARRVWSHRVPRARPPRSRAAPGRAS